MPGNVTDSCVACLRVFLRVHQDVGGLLAVGVGQHSFLVFFYLGGDGVAGAVRGSRCAIELA
jgi:hypothetical protein